MNYFCHFFSYRDGSRMITSETVVQEEIHHSHKNKYFFLPHATRIICIQFL